jgi:hypothetical protein
VRARPHIVEIRWRDCEESKLSGPAGGHLIDADPANDRLDVSSRSTPYWHCAAPASGAKA